ncbi:hypothetical protein DPEC_G00124290 [Dallia pectoralis]|uniref:Uncharacterized protein n=1 Tax=Dallia pectoralis TaxID=75939 RepID=A0ACC2GRK6_DALPE|nr:hypothetical protein DPEC_G00124290 [Dallia pectoralis]
MEEDSGQLNKSEQITNHQPASEQSSSPSQSFHCDHCVLFFNTKYFLIEHMEKVHGIEVDPSQSEGSCSPSDSSLCNSSVRVFSCRHCVFTSSNRTLIIKHERKCHKVPIRIYGKGGSLKTKKLYVRGKLLNNKLPMSGKNHQNVSAMQRKGVKGRVNTTSSSKTINIPSSSLLLKNLQAKVGSAGNISKFRVVSGTSAHGSSLNSSQLKLTNLPKASINTVTLRSEQPYFSYELDKVSEERSHTEVEQKDSHCCSLCNFSATWLEDLVNHQRSNHSYIFYSLGSGLLDKRVAEQQNLKPQTKNDSLANTAKKRANGVHSPAKKKTQKTDPDPESEFIESRQLVGPAFTFEVSEDEEERNAFTTEDEEERNAFTTEDEEERNAFTTEDEEERNTFTTEDEEERNAFTTEPEAPSAKTYRHGQSKNRKYKNYRNRLLNCKHCDYSQKSYRGMSTHYQRMHPYIRCDLQYITDPDYLTAAFRCLECPVEFATPDDLKAHYRDHHPESPNVFAMRSDQLNLVYKCFACPFTNSNGRYLQNHYKHVHPDLEIGNHLMFCSYTDKPFKAESQRSGETSSPKITDLVSSEKSLTLSEEMGNVSPTQPKACSVSVGVNEEPYHCKHCAFSNRSVVVMLVHYQKSHPHAGLTIDDIKQASLATSVKPTGETCVSPGSMDLEPVKIPAMPDLSSLSGPRVAQKDIPNLFFCQHCNYGNLEVRGVLHHQKSKHSDLKPTVDQIHLYTTAVRSQWKRSPDVAVGSPSSPPPTSAAQEAVFTPFKVPEVQCSNAPIPTRPISTVSQADTKSLYYCQFCDYYNPSVRGVMNHQILRHSTRKSTAERVVKHSAVMRKTNKLKRVLNHKKTYPNHLKATAEKVVECASEFPGGNQKPATTEFDSYQSFKSTLEQKVDKMFFCQFCNYGNPRVFGVLSHQKLRHRHAETCANEVIHHTSMLRRQKETFLSAGFDSSNSSVLISDNGNEGCSLFFCQVCNYGDLSIRGILAHQKKRHHELKTDPDDVFRHTVEVRERTTKSTTSEKVNSPYSSHMLPFPLVTEEAVLFCQFCNYSNPTMRVVVDHQRKRHPGVTTTAKQIINYTAMILVQNAKSPKSSFLTCDFVQEDLDEFFCQYCDYSNCTVRGILNHHHRSHSAFETNTAKILRHTVEQRGRPKTKQSQPPPVVKWPAIFCYPVHNDEVDNMFFCQICNYSNPTVKGVLNHQRKKHLDLKATAKQVVEYTATVRKLPPVKEDSLKSQDKDEKERGLFYCQYCDYANTTAKGVLSHQQLKHSDLKETADEVVAYPTVVCNPNKKSQINRPHKSSMKVSRSRVQKAAPLRFIKCRSCSYTTPHIYLLKRHLRINHKEKAPITTIINWAYQDGYLQAGYHCEWCVCSHTKAKVLLRHYRQRHPDKHTGLESIMLRLHAGPKTSQPAETNLKPESNSDVEPSPALTGEVPRTSPFHQSGGGETKVFQCRACPFKAASMGGIGSHYRAVHPWSVKDDGSVLDVISSRQSQEPEDQESLDVNEPSVSSETHGCPVCPMEFPTYHGLSTHCGRKHPEYDTKVRIEPDVPETPKPSLEFSCPLCSGTFHTLHGMLTHCGRKHPDYDASTYVKVPEEPRSNEGTPVYKCPVCPYVNSRPHGVLTHSQMKHPGVEARTDRLDQEIVHFADGDECVVVRKGKTIGSAGFRCNMCPVIHAKFKTLKTHYETYHKRSASNMFKTTIKHSAVIKKQLLSKYRGSQTSIVQAAILKRGKSVFIKCHLCKYFCTTKKGLARHLHINHSKPAPNEDKEFSYDCALCSYTTPICKYLAAHYRRRHGHDAFNEHFVPAFRPLRVPPTSPNQTDSLNQEIKSPGEKLKCSCCFFQCLSEKGMVSHYANCHPGVSSNSPISSEDSPKKTLPTPSKTRSRPRPPKPICKIFDPLCEEGSTWCPVKCKKCENLFFNSSLLLSIHYTNFHKEDFKQDFVVLSKNSEDVPDVYSCKYCNLIIQGSTDLCSHLDIHNEESRKLAGEPKTEQNLSETAPKTNSIATERQELPVVPKAESESHWIVTKVESVTPAIDPQLLPSDSLRPEPGEKSAGKNCNQCGQTFKSLKGLLSHMRSHAAMAALKRLDNVPHHQKQMFDRHIRHCPGTMKPFRCTLCRYRTSILSLLKNHLLKEHEGESLVTVAQDKEYTPRDTEEAANLLQIQDGNSLSDSEEVDHTEKRAYSEPPDVQRQLIHYRHLAKAQSPPEPKSTGTAHDVSFACECCIYTATHFKSMRRHYISRHNGKRLLRCKDCPFFTGFRKKLDMHTVTAHASGITEAVKDLHCPLCLYHTKNKKCMIDHIILHREEPMAPIEVRRPKLSRYLQGVVFRCHKCTFTSSSDESLLLHMHKHNDIKPYKCRLCYYDCMQLSELEAHLCNTHQVLRNHELVGHVHLEELETTLNTIKWKEMCDLESQNVDKKEETANQHVVKQQRLDEDWDNMDQLGNEEESQEETNIMHKEKHAVREGDTIKEPGPEKSGKNISKDQAIRHVDNKNMYKQSTDCEKSQGHRDEVNKKEDNKVSKTYECPERQYFSMEEYEDCHDNLDNDVEEEQFTDCEEYQKPEEINIREKNDHEIPVLTNKEGKKEFHSHSEKRDHESLKNYSLKPVCNSKGQLGGKTDENDKNPNTFAPTGASTTLGVDSFTAVTLIPTTKENGLSCNFCGRTLKNRTDLELHVQRHGM